MTSMVPIAITILTHRGKYLFLKRKNPPYEGLWSMVGGKVGVGEHIRHAAIREIMEETGAQQVTQYEYRGLVSERLVQSDGQLSSHFLIFIGHAEIDDFQEFHREGELELFSNDEVAARREEFLPSDWHMFGCFKDGVASTHYEAELEHENGQYRLNYYRKAE